MQIISPFINKSQYTKYAVDNYIGQLYPEYKYYSFYYRKDFMPVKVHRYYVELPTGQKKLYLFFQPIFSVVRGNHYSIFSNCLLFIPEKR